MSLSEKLIDLIVEKATIKADDRLKEKKHSGHDPIDEKIKTVLEAIQALPAQLETFNKTIPPHLTKYYKPRVAEECDTINGKDSRASSKTRGMTPIAVALQFGLLDLVKQIRESGGDPNLCIMQYDHGTEFAGFRNANGDARAEPEIMAMLRAILENDDSSILLNESKDTSITKTNKIIVNTATKNNILKSAVLFQHIKILNYMILLKTDVNARDVKNGNTCLHYAISQGWKNGIVTLLTAGADTGIINHIVYPRVGYNALMWACEFKNRVELIQLILDNSKPAQKTICSALIHALNLHQIRVAKLLLPLFENLDFADEQTLDSSSHNTSYKLITNERAQRHVNRELELLRIENDLKSRKRELPMALDEVPRKPSLLTFSSKPKKSSSFDETKSISALSEPLLSSSLSDDGAADSKASVFPFIDLKSSEPQKLCNALCQIIREESALQSQLLGLHCKEMTILEKCQRFAPKTYAHYQEIVSSFAFDALVMTDEFGMTPLDHAAAANSHFSEIVMQLLLQQAGHTQVNQRKRPNPGTSSDLFLVKRRNSIPIQFFDYAFSVQEYIQTVPKDQREAEQIDRCQYGFTQICRILEGIDNGVRFNSKSQIFKIYLIDLLHIFAELNKHSFSRTACKPRYFLGKIAEQCQTMAVYEILKPEYERWKEYLNRWHPERYKEFMKELTDSPIIVKKANEFELSALSLTRTSRTQSRSEEESELISADCSYQQLL